MSTTNTNPSFQNTPKEDNQNPKTIYIDYTDVRKFLQCQLIQQGIDPKSIDQTYCLYYDETNNVKKFHIRPDGTTNVPTDTIFVLGGIEGNGSISLSELKNIFHLQNNVKEVKSKHIYEGDFADCMKSDRLETFLDLLITKGWHVHFQSLNLLYWSIVDIIDSIEKTSYKGPSLVNEIKAMLYGLIKTHTKELLEIMHKYNYPDIKDEKSLNDFFSELISLVTNTNYGSDYIRQYLRNQLIMLLKAGKDQSSAAFIQNNREDVLLERLTDFYRCEICTWKNSVLILDEESDIISDINDFGVKLNGEKCNNYSFVDSKNNEMIQLSDIAVGIISKYLKFIDQVGYNLPTVVQDTFKEKRQLRIFKKLNIVLRLSRDFNPVFFNQTTSLEYHGLFNNYINEYSK